MKRIALATLGISAALLLAPTAHADEESFVVAVADDGMPAGTTALALGHQVCTDILTNGVAGVDDEVRTGLAAGLSSHDVASLIADAVNELCPAGIPAVKAWASPSANS